MVADQLRISQGWVRCGMCQSVFDASQDLQSLPDEILAPENPQSVASAPVESQESVQSQEAGEAAPVLEAAGADTERAIAPSESNLASDDTQDAAPAEGEPVEDSEGVKAAEEQPESLSDSELQLPPETPSETATEQGATEPSFVDQSQLLMDDGAQHAELPGAAPVERDEQNAQPLVAESETEAETAATDVEVASEDALLSIHVDEATPGVYASQPAADAAVDAEGEVDGPASAEPGFVRQARRQAFWHSSGMRAALVLGSLVAAAGIAGQYAWQQRDVLAAQYPALSPVLAKACSLAGCELQARREIADVVISGSGFKQLADAQQYQWSLTLENRSDVAVAMPMAELTLTDAQDKPLLRRVIDLKPLGAPEQLQARQEWSVSIPVQVQELDAPVAGYRALVFYP